MCEVRGCRRTCDSIPKPFHCIRSNEQGYLPFQIICEADRCASLNAEESCQGTRTLPPKRYVPVRWRILRRHSEPKAALEIPRKLRSGVKHRSSCVFEIALGADRPDQELPPGERRSRLRSSEGALQGTPVTSSLGLCGCCPNVLLAAVSTCLQCGWL